MPILNDVRKLKTITLPSFEGSEVVIYSTVLVADLDGVDLNNADAIGMNLLPKLIKSWNFTNEEGLPLAVSLDNIKKLPATDATFIIENIAQLILNQKKN
jgi:hypothetical protein